MIRVVAGIIFCLCLLLPHEQVCGQQMPMLHFTIKDGLPGNNIYSIYRDSKGFLWFASDKGIARYNGLSFEAFTTNDGLPDNEVFFFREDYLGRLWLGTYNGELCFYKDGVFHTAANTSFLKMPSAVPHITNIVVAPDSSIVINFYNMRYMVNVFADRLKFYDLVDLGKRQTGNAFNSSLYKRKVDRNGFELVYADRIVRIDTSANRIDSSKYQIGYKTIYLQSQNGGWLANDTMLYTGEGSFVRRDTETIVNSITTYKVHDYYRSEGNTLLGGNAGLLINDSVNVLTGHNVSSITQDHYGNYWVATLDNGVYCFHKDLVKTRLLHNAYQGEIKYARTIDGRVFFASADNSLWEVQQGAVKQLVDFRTFKGVDHVPSKDGAVMVDAQNSVYYCFMRFHTVVHNWNTNKTQVLTMETPFHGSKEVFRQDQNVYVKGLSSVVQIGYAGLSGRNAVAWQSVVKDNQARVYGIAQAADKTIWYATVTDMYKIVHGDTIRDDRFRNYPLKQLAFIDKYMVGYTHNNQLLICDYQGAQLIVDTVKGQECVWDKLYHLDRQHLLISTNNLYRLLTINPAGSREKFTVVPVEDAFVPVQAESVCADSAFCYFFRSNDITIIPLRTILKAPMPPTLYFTTFSAAGKSYWMPDILSDDFEIPYHDSRSITMRFSRLVANGQSIIQQYSVSRNGQDNWQTVSGGELNLVDPGYGAYTVKIRARTLSGSYCAPVVFILQIGRPFWATWWFVLVLAGVVIGIVIVAVRLRVRYLVLKSEKDHQDNMKFIKSEYKALNALMNPHFVFNTLNNVQGLVNRDDKLAANEYIRVFADLIRQNMHNLSKEMITLQREIDLVVNYLLLEKLRFKELLNYSLEIDDRIDMSEIMVPPLLVQPLVENSIKHGILPLESVEGRVVIRIYERDSMLFIEVRDNGVGLAKAKEKAAGTLHESFAMENIKSRMEQLALILNRKIELDMREEAGEGGRQWTVVSIIILM